MKKAISLFLLIIVIMLCFCGCEKTNSDSADKNSIPVESTVKENIVKESLSEKLIREIDGAYLEESKLSEFSTTLGMVKLAEKYTDKWKDVANEYYNKMMEYDGIVQPNEVNYSSEDFHNTLLKMKEDWEEYHNKEISNYMIVIHCIYDSGTICGPLLSQYEYEMYKDWALKLVDIYEQLGIDFDV